MVEPSVISPSCAAAGAGAGTATVPEGSAAATVAFLLLLLPFCLGRTSTWAAAEGITTASAICLPCEALKDLCRW